MTHIFTLFLDGVGLGEEDPRRNPFSKARLPRLSALLDGRRLVADNAPIETETTTLLELDACMGVDGMPQSASGQAALLTGRNIALEIGMHYGPKPNQAIRDIIQNDNLFAWVKQKGGSVSLLNGYPPRYFEAIQRGRRLYSTIPLAIVSAGLRLQTAEDMQVGRAFSADFTGRGWAERVGFPPAPIYSPLEAGRHMALACQHADLAWFDYWLTDYVGHKQDMDQAISLLETLDAVLDGFLQNWRMDEDLVVLVSDHGNVEDLQSRGHTRNPVPCLITGPPHLRRAFARGLHDLTGYAPAVLRVLFEEGCPS
jgi:2,3-bisphosphoglycerate-independent phosphoglycerate mutase